MRSQIFSAAIAFVLALSGCAAPHQFAKPDATWKSHIGQLKYSNRKRTIIGDVVVQERGRDEFQLDFIKGGGIPLMSLRQDATVAHVEGLLAHGSWHGTPDAAPATLQPWLRLRSAFNSAATGPRPGHVEVRYSGRDLGMLFVASPTDEQRFVFQFSR